MFSLAQRSAEPVPGERALGGDDESVAIRGDDLEQRIGARLHVAVNADLAGGVEDAGSKR